MERIDKILSNLGYGTRKDLKKIVKNGMVQVNGVIIKDSAMKVDPEKDKIVINGEEKITLGKYGRARLQYLKSHKRGLWSELIMTEKLTKHLKDVDDNASNKVKNIINNLAKNDNFPIYYDGIIDQLEWVKTMNNYKNIAEEIVYNELICF